MDGQKAENELINKTVFIIGGSGGIGQGIVKSLLNNGFGVIIGYNKSIEAIDNIKVKYPKQSGLISSFKIDLLDIESITNMDVPDADALIFSAGLPSLSPLSECSLDEINNQFRIHVISPLVIIQKYLKIDNSRLKNIIFISSTAGLELSAHGGAYALSKSGTISLSKLLAKELRNRGIRVNTIAPGWCETPMADFVLSKRNMTMDQLKNEKLDNSIVVPDEIGCLCISLLSNDLIHLQGQVIVLESLPKK